MLTSTFSPNASHRHAPLFKGKDKPDASSLEGNASSTSLPLENQTDEAVFQAAQQSEPPESKIRSTILEKMLSNWGLLTQSADKSSDKPLAKPPGKSLGKKVSFESNDNSPPASLLIEAPISSGQAADWRSSLSKLHIPGFRLTAPPGARIKKKNPHGKAPVRPPEPSGSPLSKTRSHGQDAANKATLAPIHEDDGDSLLQRSLPNIGAPLDQLLQLPPQLPAALEDLTQFAERQSKTPASSLWVEGTTGHASQVSSAYPPSRNQELPQEADEYTDDDSDADTESLQSNTSSAFLVDDDLEVQQEREKRGTKKWAKAVKTQQLGSLISQQISKPDIHQNSRYLDGDSDLESEDQALFYDSEDVFSDSDSDTQSVKSVKQKPQPKPESLLTKAVQDPKFNLVTENQKLLKESNARIRNAVATETLAHDEQRIHDLQQNYSPEQLADNYRKLQVRLSQIRQRQHRFREQLQIPPGMTMTDKVAIWHNVLSNLKLETSQKFEALAAAAHKGKLPESSGSAQLRALMAKGQKIELKQQQVDAAVGLYNDLEANEAQIQSRLALYHEALGRNRHQSMANLLAQATEDGLSDNEKLEHRHNLGHRYSSAELKQFKNEVRAQHNDNLTPQLQALDQALKFQEATVSNIYSRLKKPQADAAHSEKLAEQLTHEFTKVELQEALHQLPQQTESQLVHGRNVLALAIKMHVKQ